MTLTGCGKKGAPLPPEGLVPEEVTSVRAKGVNGSLLISWNIPRKNSDGSDLVDLAGFKLYKKSGSAECIKCPSEAYPVYVDIDLEAPGAAIVKEKTITFVDSDLQGNKHYSYKVAPYNKSGYFGAFSKAINVNWKSPPLAPEGLEGSASDKAAMLKWKMHKNSFINSTSENFLGYHIYRSNKSGDYPSTPVAEKHIKEESYTDIGLENNRQYYYTVKTVIKAGDTTIESDPSREIVLIPIDTIPPAPPKRLTVVLSQAGTRLFWETDDDSDIYGYNLYRRKDSQLAAEKINETPIEGVTFNDYDVLDSEIYYYSITAVDNSLQRNESAPSEEVNIKILK